MKALGIAQRAKNVVKKIIDRVSDRRLSLRQKGRVLDLYYNQGITSSRRIAEIVNSEMATKVYGTKQISHTSVWRIIQDCDPPLAFQLRMKRYAPLLEGL